MIIESLARIRQRIIKGLFSREGEKAIRRMLAAMSFIPTGAIQALVGPGAIALTSYITEIETTGADAFTLANGEPGQIKVVKFVIDGGDGTITPANLNGGTTVVLSAVGDEAIFQFDGEAWTAIGLNNLLGTGATPVLA